MTIAAAGRFDIKDIARFSTRRWGQDRAGRYIADLADRMVALSSDADRGRPLDDLFPPWRSVRVHRHLVIFRIDRDMVLVARILHDGMDLKRHLP